MNDPKFLIIDLFCGAGGTTVGFVAARNSIAKVIACVNHDPKAIESHWKNHPEVKHFEEDIRTLDLTELAMIAKDWQDKYPAARLILWASLECINFSKAKGGQPRDPDSRTLANHLVRYVNILKPDYIKIENVVEFMSWGPLDDLGKPVSRKNGSDWIKWRRKMCSCGYIDDWKELNSADYGAYTSRNRLFGIFAKPGLPIAWPESTHSKRPGKGMFDVLKKWMPVKDVLDFSDEGKSIFGREKPLVDKTLERIYAGLVKFVAKGDTAFISKYFSGRPKGKVNSVNEPAPTVTTFGGNSLVQVHAANIGVDGPAGSITTKDHHAIVQPISLLKYNSTNKDGKHIPTSLEDPSPVVSTHGRLGLIQGVFIMQRNTGDPKSKIVDIEGPARTITATGGNQELVQLQFLTGYYGNGENNSSIEVPCPVIPTKDRFALIDPEYFIDKHFGKSSQNQSIEDPAGTILPTDKHRLIEASPFIMPTNYANPPKSVDEPSSVITANRKHHYLVNPAYYSGLKSTEDPAPTIVARQDKVPLRLLQIDGGDVAIPVFNTDSQVTVRIKQFMAIYRLADIKMRMLRVKELLKIQGFPESYILCGNQSDQKKFIGNSVAPIVVTVWIQALNDKVFDSDKQKVA